MSEFTESIKKFDKIRDYMSDFFVYGFKSRMDFGMKSSRTYDNEKRRIENYVGKYIKWDYSKAGKAIYFSIDGSEISTNPLYKAWKSKSFTDNDIMLHFYINDILQDNELMSIDMITDEICIRSQKIFDIQTVRNKCNEYTQLGLLKCTKSGKKLLFSLGKTNFNIGDENIQDAISFFQNEYPMGVIGSFIMDKTNCVNNLFSFKHNYIVHTLEDEILLQILKSINEEKNIVMTIFSGKSKRSKKHDFIPLKVLESSQTGRRYICGYEEAISRFISFRLDTIKKISIGTEKQNYKELKNNLNKNITKCWGVSFGNTNRHRNDIFTMKLFINELTEPFVIERLYREGRGGTVERESNNIYIYKKELFDANEMLGFAKTFIGRIIDIDCNNQMIADKIKWDISRMVKMYEEE